MYVAIMGYGVVGSGVAAVIKLNNEKISKACGEQEVKVKYILDLRKFPGDINENLVIDDFNIILNDPEVKIVAETMGGVNPAFDFTSKLLKAGKSVVTSNKELVAMKGRELLKIARENNVNFMFEASVGGGIPIIRPLINDLAANEILEIDGILNGTTNYILTQMLENNIDFDAALKQAQSLGYAERDPSADVDGLDACRKICILAALSFGNHFYPQGVYTNGIREITLSDAAAAKSIECVIKLIASAKKNDDGKVSLSVSPCAVSSNTQLGNVGGVFNAVLVKGNAVDDVVFYGKGAGKMATASAVVADIIDCARHIDKRLDFGWEDENPDKLADYSLDEGEFLIRAQGDRDELMSAFCAKSLHELENGEICFESSKISFNELEKISSALKNSKVLSSFKIMKF